jgi:lipoate-protein ligase B
MVEHSLLPVSSFKFQVSNQWLCVDIPLMDYKEALDLQRSLVDAKTSEIMGQDLILFLEHPPVFTLGRRGGRDHLLVDDATLGMRGIEVLHAERGGDITYHGPGQLVVYPVVDLKRRQLKVLEFVGALEEVMIRVAADWGIKAGRNPKNRGIWIDNKKMGSIGIAIRRGVSFHGIALNVNTSMDPFSWINPCGLTGVEMASMRQALGREIEMEEVKTATKLHIREIFGVELEQTDLNDIYKML